ncbi:MAG: ATP-binding protein [Muribaculaceae bacterium]|nr:ATP-binding protein [Muribaculaceae bacterium]
MRFDKAGIYERRRTGKLIFLGVAAIAIIFFLIVSNNLVKELARQERDRMKIWASATEKLAKANIDTDFDFLLAIISQNNSIPVLVADEDYTIIDFRNFTLPEKEHIEKPVFEELSETNRSYLSKRLRDAGRGMSLRDLSKTDPHFIRVEVYHNTYQYIYYEDSILLKRLSLYPYIQLVVMIILIVIIYFAVIYTKKAEQNRVWAGLSKETAHQLGTPISSLMAWNELLKATGSDQEVTDEIQKDINRLSVIADRFSKIGSRPEVSLEYVNETVARSLLYMKSRISGKVEIISDMDSDDHGVLLSPPLFEWVMENLTKNAVDAMGGEGKITITSGKEKDKVWIEVKDTGKGIARKNFKNVFSPGYTTKKRGWGLGLTLAKRIIEDYHGGKIFVKESEIGKGTTFRIELPSA